MPEDLGREDVERVARLARLRLSDSETDRFAEQLRRILAYARQVQEVATTGVAPMAHPFPDESPRSREDAPAGSLPRDEALAAAPDADRQGGLFKVPRVIG